MPINIDIKLEPQSGFDVPYNAAYQIYSSLLQIIKQDKEELSKNIHDSDVSNLNIGQLKGPFGDGTLQYHKSLKKNADYELSIGITDLQEEDIFQSFFKQIILENKALELSNGSLILKEMESSYSTYDEIIERSKRDDVSSLNFNFVSPTCIEFRNSEITEMFPHRTAVFTTLVSKWNDKAPDKYRTGLSRETIGKSLIEKPELNSLKTHSVKVGTFYNRKKKHEQSLLKQGFVGKCRYDFSSRTSEKVKNILTALTMFSEFSGVGSDVSRGCGSVETEVW